MIHFPRFVFSWTWSHLTGQVLECSLAKPPADQKSSGGPNSQKPALLPTYPPRLGYGLVGGGYGALGAGYGGAGFGQVRCPVLCRTVEVCTDILYLFPYAPSRLYN